MSTETFIDDEPPSRKKPRNDDSNFSIHKCCEESGLVLKPPPEKCLATDETIIIIRKLKKNLQKQFDYPRNVQVMLKEFIEECQDVEVFKHYLLQNVMRVNEDSFEEHIINDCVFRILLSVPMLQDKLMDHIFEKAMDSAIEGKCADWIQMILKCFSSLDNILNTEKVSSHLVNLLDVTTEKNVRLEIITAIPDIVGDQEHENIASEMSRFLSEDYELIPVILDCLTNLCLSDDQYEILQKKALNILTSSPKCNYYSNFVKFLLMPGRVGEANCSECIQGLRNALGWPTSVSNQEEINMSQVLTATAIRNTMISSKVIANSWLKMISSSKLHADYKPIDIVVLILLYSTTEERQRQVENVIKKQLKLNILKEEIVDEAFEKYQPIFKEHLKSLIELCNSLFKSKTDPTVEIFASHLYHVMYAVLSDCRHMIIATLLQLGLDRKQCLMNILSILTDIAAKDLSSLKSQSVQMLTLLDRMDGMNLQEIKSVMNLICALAYSYENSTIRDEVHMIIRKELSCSCPKIKIQGILAAVHAIKYIVATSDDKDGSIDLPDDVSYSSVTYLPQGPLREAAQLVELISRSTRQFPDMIAFFYDEFSEVITNSSNMNKQFVSWITDAVTNDLQQNFIVDNIQNDKIGQIKITMQYCINDEAEMDEMIAINMASLVLETKDDVYVSILSSLFQLVQALHYKQHNGDLSSIDALLGCPVVMPLVDLDTVADMDHNVLSNILDCLFHCANWFRELINAFATQNDDALKSKLFNRIINVEDVEAMITEILIRSNIYYKPPSCTFDVSKYTGGITDKKAIAIPANKQKQQKKPNETILPETVKSQATQGNIPVKTKLEVIQNLPLRQLSLKLLTILNNDLEIRSTSHTELNVKSFRFLLKYVISNLENIMLSKIKRKTFLTKDVALYDHKKAEECAKTFNQILPKLISHLDTITEHIDSLTADNSQDDNGLILTSETLILLECLENEYKMLKIYFSWIGFKNQHNPLLKTSLRTIATHNNEETSAILSLKDLTLAVVKYFQKHEKYCLQLPTAVSLIELLISIQDHSDSTIVQKIIRDMANNFLSQQWKTPEGTLEKGLYYNQSIDKLAGIHLMNAELVALKNLTLQLTKEIEYLKSRGDVLNSFKAINKANFPILYRNLGAAVHDATKTLLNKGLSNAEHLEVWKDVVTILKSMSEIAKTLDTRTNLSAYFKKSLPILKLFLTQGIPIIEMQFKNYTEEILEVLKILQQSTRFLQSLCCHSRLKKDSALMAKVPFMRQLLETLIYKVKAALAANNCSEAFWMGNLKNKNIHGEIIASQQSVGSEESVEDCDDQLPDDDSDDSDDEMINPESKSLSDVI